MRMPRQDFFVDLDGFHEDVGEVARNLALAGQHTLQKSLLNLPESATIPEAQDISRQLGKAHDVLDAASMDFTDACIAAKDLKKQLDELIRDAICEENEYYDEDEDEDDE